MIMDLAGSLPSVCFPMGMSGEQSPDVHKTLQSFQFQYQSTARNNICQALPRSAFTEAQRSLASCPDVRPRWFHYNQLKL